MYSRLNITLFGRRKLPALLLNQWPRYAGFGGAAGILTGSAMMLYKMRTIEADGVEDRCVNLVSLSLAWLA